MTAQPGTYMLILAANAAGTVRIGKLGTLPLQPGFYLYVGSAFGPGGLAARIGHHRQVAARPHWHIDYLRAVCDLVTVWFTTDATRRECSWASGLAQMAGACVPLPGFGSSDCDCDAHLFWFKRLPSVRAFRQRVRTRVQKLTSRIGVRRGRK
jgi:Uri superfamily endonuclease